MCFPSLRSLCLFTVRKRFKKINEVWENNNEHLFWVTYLEGLRSIKLEKQQIIEIFENKNIKPFLTILFNLKGPYLDNLKGIERKFTDIRNLYYASYFVGNLDGLEFLTKKYPDEKPKVKYIGKYLIMGNQCNLLREILIENEKTEVKHWIRSNYLTFLYTSIIFGNLEILKTLIEFCEPTTYILCVCIEFNKLDFLQILMKETFLQLEDFYRLMDVTFRYNNITIFSYLLNLSRDLPGYTDENMIKNACREGHIDIIKYILSDKPNLIRLGFEATVVYKEFNNFRYFIENYDFDGDIYSFIIENGNLDMIKFYTEYKFINPDWNNILIRSARNISGLPIVQYCIEKEGAFDVDQALLATIDSYNRDIAMYLIKQGATNIYEVLHMSSKCKKSLPKWGGIYYRSSLKKFLSKEIFRTKQPRRIRSLN